VPDKVFPLKILIVYLLYLSFDIMGPIVFVISVAMAYLGSMRLSLLLHSGVKIITGIKTLISQIEVLHELSMVCRELVGAKGLIPKLMSVLETLSCPPWSEKS